MPRGPRRRRSRRADRRARQHPRCRSRIRAGRERHRAADRLPHDVDARPRRSCGAARCAACCRCSTSATARSPTRDEEFARVLAEQIGRALDYTTLRGDDAQRGLTLRGRFNHVIGTLAGDGRGLRDDRARGADRRDRAAPRRDRHRQGPARARDPRQQRAARRAVRPRRLHDAAGGARRERAVRSRARRVHRRRQRA